VTAAAGTTRAPHSSFIEPLLAVALGGLLGTGLIAATDAVYGLQGSAAGTFAVLPFGYSYAAGMVAAVNPCGVLLLPSLVVYYLAGDVGARSPWYERTTSAFGLGVMATLGFVSLFAAIGLVFAFGGRALGAYFPIGGAAVGVALVVLGIWTSVTGRAPGIGQAQSAVSGARLERNARALFLFGVAYSLASLACTLPVFLVVVGTALATNGLVPAVGQFVVFALGMGTVITAVVVGAAFFRGAVSSVLRRAVPYVQRISAALLVGAGVYLIHYWLSAA
jgi:cytochrome c-type biogenesis protein